MEGAPEYVTKQGIRTRVGQTQIQLSKRSISDIIEKWVIDYLLVNHKESIEYRATSGYDFTARLGGQEFFVNIKTEEGSREYSWLCSSSVLVKQKEILDRLYFYKLTYDQSGSVISIIDDGIAGPMDQLIELKRVVTHQKGDPLPKGILKGHLPTHYNGKHCFLSKENFHSLSQEFAARNPNSSTRAS